MILPRPDRRSMPPLPTTTQRKQRLLQDQYIMMNEEDEKTM